MQMSEKRMDDVKRVPGSEASRETGGGLFEKRMSRREMLRLTIGAGLGIALGASGMDAWLRHGAMATCATTADNTSGNASGQATVPFHGLHQPGIVTPQQTHMVFAAFDLTTTSRQDLRDLLRTWTADAARMCQGKAIGSEHANVYLPPDDTGEAMGLSPARLTITFGFGPTLFVKDGRDVFGLAARRPAVLQEIPAMPGDNLQPARSGGDLCIQACADDPQVAFHAIRNLLRRAQGVAAARWIQTGFLSAPRGRDGSSQTPRNLMGFKDGTVNIREQDVDLQKRFLWVGESDKPAWMHGGTYLVTRRIRIFIEVWDRESLRDQEDTFGRHKDSGAPYGGSDEFSPVQVDKLPANSHVRIAHGDGKTRILRRGYSYNDGIDPRTGQTDAGLFFISFQRDPIRQFVPMLRRLAEHDALNEYIQHTSSAVFACPPGVRDQSAYIGRPLLE
jgi:deferrochelatase/peroxidase EfeB